MNIERISATQLSQFKSCPRKWYFRYVLGHKYPQTPAMKYGTAIHTDLEEFLRGKRDTFTLPESKHVFDAGIVPARERVYAVEIDVSTEKIMLCDARVALMGYIDLVWITEEGTIKVWDWKTRSSFSYAPDPVELANDLQAILYAYAMFVHLDRKGFVLDEIPFSHVNILKKAKGGPDHTIVEARMSRHAVETHIKAHVEPQIYEMSRMAVLGLQWVPTHKTMCFEYGRCEHMDECSKVAYSAVAPELSDQAWSLEDLFPKEGDMTTTIDDLMRANGATQPAQPAPQPMAQQPSPQMPQPQYAQPAPDAAQYAQQPQPQPMPDIMTMLGVNPQPMTQPAPQPMAQPAPQPMAQPAPQPMAPQQTQVPAAPLIQPPDAQPDIRPKSVLEQTVQEFDWTGVDGIGAKGAEKIIEYLQTKTPFTHMAQLAQGFDFKLLPSVGEKGAQNIRIALGQGVPFNPAAAPAVASDGQPLAHNEFIQQPDGAVLMNGPRTEPTPEEWLKKAAASFDTTGIIPTYAQNLPPHLKETLNQYVVQKKQEQFRANNPDYAPPAAHSDPDGLARREAQPAPEPIMPTVLHVVADAQGNQAVESFTAALYGVTRVVLSHAVGKISVELELALDPSADATPIIEAAKAYLLSE